MNVYIFADLEGVCGISGAEYVSGRFAAAGSQLMADDINAVAAACFESGAERVIVRDGHGSGVNFPATALNPAVELVQGATGSTRFFGIEEADAMILLGYHAISGTPGAILSHTYSSATIACLKLNGKAVGEAGLDARIAGEHNVPVIMISGDDKTCEEAGQWVPQAVRCPVKYGCTRQSGRMMPLDAARSALRRATILALKRFKAGEISPLRPEYPATLRWEVIPPAKAPEIGFSFISETVFERTGNNLEKVFLG